MSTKAKPGAARPRDGSRAVAPPQTYPLLPPPAYSVRQSWDSCNRATPADHLVADSHRALAPHFPVASFLLPATVLSYGRSPHSKPRLATDSSIAYASAPCGADAR